MVLNYIWIAFFLIAFAIALGKLIFAGDTTVFPSIMDSTFAQAKTAFEISLGLTGVLSLWMGIMKIGERGGLVAALARLLSPILCRIFPEIPKGHPAMGTMFMNFSANMLGLDNAATPMGLKAMQELQELNPHKDTASNPMIMFLVLNTSGLTLIPVSVLLYRAEMGAANPTDVFIPILLATTVATLVGLVATSIYQRINLLNGTMLLFLLGICTLVAGGTWGMMQLSQVQIETVSTSLANVILFSVIILFIVAGMRARINVYEAFIEGAKEGFTTAVRIIPYLVAILVAIGVFRASGGMNVIMDGVAWCANAVGMGDDFVGALPTAIMKPLSGSGARGMMIDAMNTYGADSFAGRLACLFQGATDTTFYILAVYFGSVGIKKTRHAVGCGLLADAAGIVAAVIIAYIFFG
ncbi:MAG: spore maturation protein [Bacteroidaceae bacterium]|nr:spore maturation protein [Bacteroidaceae bacterium]MBR5455993.1 spore maturation protein [Bacteroidaceae bacterium]